MADMTQAQADRLIELLTQLQAQSGASNPCSCSCPKTCEAEALQASTIARFGEQAAQASMQSIHNFQLVNQNTWNSQQNRLYGVGNGTQ